MKLFFCPACLDVRRIRKAPSSCECGHSRAALNPHTQIATVTPDTVVIGIPDDTFIEVLSERPDEGKGLIFPAFILPRKVKTVQYSL